MPSRGPGDKGCIAEVSIWAGRVEIACPARQQGWGALAAVTLGFVEIAEFAAPKGTTPLCSRLLTTVPVGTLAEATEVVAPLSTAVAYRAIIPNLEVGCARP